MHIDWWTLGLQTINLLVLVWILSRFLFRPIADIVRLRQAAADELLKKAKAEEARAEEEEKQAEKDIEEAAKARGGVLQSAAEEAAAEKQRILEEARTEADELRANAKAEIAELRETEARKSSQQASELAVAIAAKLFARLPQGAQVDGFIVGLAEEVGKLPERTRNEIGEGSEPVLLRSARDLTADEAKACEVALSDALGRPIALKVETVPELIAGLEIETEHVLVRNNFRADLERIATELTSDGAE